MAITRWDPFNALARLDREFDDLMRRAWGTSAMSSPSTAGFVPAVEMGTEGSDVVITLELPGVDIDEDLDVEVAEGRLTVSGERQDRRSGAEGRVLVRELRYGSFRREFALPEGVTADDVQASYDRGLLTLRVRDVARAASPARKIPIRSAGQTSVEAHRTVEGQVEEGPAQS